MMPTRSIVLVASLLALAASCATTDVEDPDRAPRACVTSSLVRTFDAINDKHVYVREGANRHFLLTMRSRCVDLENAISIAIAGTTSRVCSGSFGRILYRDHLDDSGPQSCIIDTVESVGSKEHAEKIVQTRTDPSAAEREGWTEEPIDN